MPLFESSTPSLFPSGARPLAPWAAADILPEWVSSHRRIGVTAGASTPEVLVSQVVERLKQWGFTRVEEVEWIEEDVRFALPAELKV